jgi:hypothetical protein
MVSGVEHGIVLELTQLKQEIGGIDTTYDTFRLTKSKTNLRDRRRCSKPLESGFTNDLIAH